MMKFLNLMILIAGVSSITVSSMSHATHLSTDVKEYPGSACQAYFGTSASSIIKYGGAKSYNNASGPMWVTCPVAKDNFTGTNGIYYASVSTLRGNRAVDAFYCLFINTSVNGNVAASDSERGSTFLYGNSTLSFNINTNLGGSYVFQCRVPRDSSIVSYTVYEYDSSQ